MQLQNHCLTLIRKNKSLLSATSILSCSRMAYNTTACTDYVDFAKCQDRFGRLSLFRNHSNYLDLNLKVFRKGDNKKSSDWSKI